MWDHLESRNRICSTSGDKPHSPLCILKFSVCLGVQFATNFYFCSKLAQILRVDWKWTSQHCPGICFYLIWVYFQEISLKGHLQDRKVGYRPTTKEYRLCIFACVNFVHHIFWHGYRSLFFSVLGTDPCFFRFCPKTKTTWLGTSFVILFRQMA